MQSLKFFMHKHSYLRSNERSLYPIDIPWNKWKQIASKYIVQNLLFIKYFISYTCNYYLSKESSTTFEHIIIIITINHRIMCIKIQYYLLSRDSVAFVFVVITFPKSI